MTIKSTCAYFLEKAPNPNDNTGHSTYQVRLIEYRSESQTSSSGAANGLLPPNAPPIVEAAKFRLDESLQRQLQLSITRSGDGPIYLDIDFDYGSAKIALKQLSNSTQLPPKNKAIIQGFAEKYGQKTDIAIHTVLKGHFEIAPYGSCWEDFLSGREAFFQFTEASSREFAELLAKPHQAAVMQLTTALQPLLKAAGVSMSYPDTIHHVGTESPGRVLAQGDHLVLLTGTHSFQMNLPLLVQKARK